MTPPAELWKRLCRTVAQYPVAGGMQQAYVQGITDRQKGAQRKCPYRRAGRIEAWQQGFIDADPYVEACRAADRALRAAENARDLGAWEVVQTARQWAHDAIDSETLQHTVIEYERRKDYYDRLALR